MKKDTTYFCKTCGLEHECIANIVYKLSKYGN